MSEIKPKTIREWQTEIHSIATEKGWWDGCTRDADGRVLLNVDAVLARISLIHSELSEAVEEARCMPQEPPDFREIAFDCGKPVGFATEIADAVIRILDLCGALGIDLEQEVDTKHSYNRTRPRRHGGKLA